MLTLAAVLSRKPDVLSTEIDGEIVLMSVREGCYVGLNEVGSEIWRRIEAPVRVSALCADLAQAYDGDPRAIERDVLELLNQLNERRLLDVTE